MSFCLPRRVVRAQGGRTALLEAGIYDRVSCMQLLLDAGADTNAKDSVRGGVSRRECGWGA